MLACSHGDFRPTDTSRVRWLGWESDFAFAGRFWPTDPPLSQSEWERCRNDGHRFCARIVDGEIAALAADYRYAEGIGMVAAVRTAERSRRLGYGKAVVAFVTAPILSTGRLALCETRDGNTAMIRTAQRVGFRTAGDDSLKQDGILRRDEN